jgi:hypothetical protein
LRDIRGGGDGSPDYKQVGTIGEGLLGGGNASLISGIRCSWANSRSDEHRGITNLGTNGRDLLRRTNDCSGPRGYCKGSKTSNRVNRRAEQSDFGEVTFAKGGEHGNGNDLGLR